MFATKLVALALGAEPGDGPSQACGFCGRHAPAREANGALKDNFTNGDELVSPWVCWACEACLNARETRSAHLVAGGVFRRLERKEVWRILLDPPEAPFVIYLTLSGQKHGLFRQEVATSRAAFRLQAEDLSGWFVRAKHEEWMRTAIGLRRHGVRSASIESGRYDSADYLKARCEIADFERLVSKLRPSQLWKIIFGTMPGKEDLEGL